jgi:hypothetical protein
MRFSNLQFGLLVALLLGNAIILFGLPTWFWLRLPAIISLVFILPGLAWLPLFGWLQARDAVEQSVLIPGVSSLLVGVCFIAGGFAAGAIHRRGGIDRP